MFSRLGVLYAFLYLWYSQLTMSLSGCNSVVSRGIAIIRIAEASSDGTGVIPWECIHRHTHPHPHTHTHTPTHPPTHTHTVTLSFPWESSGTSWHSDVNNFFNVCLFIIFNVYLFIIGCAGSSLLYRLFSSCGEEGPPSSCDVQASHWGDLFCGAQALGCAGLSSSAPEL